MVIIIIIIILLGVIFLIVYLNFWVETDEACIGFSQ